MKKEKLKKKGSMSEILCGMLLFVCMNSFIPPAIAERNYVSTSFDSSVVEKSYASFPEIERGPTFHISKTDVSISRVNYDILKCSIDKLSDRQISMVLSEIKEEMAEYLQVCKIKNATIRLFVDENGCIVKKMLEELQGCSWRALINLKKIDRLAKRLCFPCDEGGEILLSIKFE